MEELARLGLFLSCLLAIYVGVRTLLIWRRTRMLPELAVGVNVLGIATGGAVLTALGALSARSGEPSSVPWLAFGLFCLVVHVTAQAIGNWKIFRPTDRWPMVLSAVIAVLACVWMSASLVSPEPSTPRSIGFLLLRLVGMTWAAWECFRYAAQLRRRVVLGLAEPMIAHRIQLWGVGAVAQCIAIGLDLGAFAAIGASLASMPAGLHVISVLGLVGTAAIALAFFPPKAYVRMITAVGAEA